MLLATPLLPAGTDTFWIKRAPGNSWNPKEKLMELILLQIFVLGGLLEELTSAADPSEVIPPWRKQCDSWMKRIRSFGGCL